MPGLALLVLAIVLAIFWVFAQKILAAFGVAIPSVVMQLVGLLIALLMVIYSLGCLGLIDGMPLHRLS